MYDKDANKNKKRPVEAVADMNNQGVSYFKIGDLSGALTCFRAALQESKVAFSNPGGDFRTLSPVSCHDKEQMTDGSRTLTHQWLPSAATTSTDGSCSLPTTFSSSVAHSNGTETTARNKRPIDVELFSHTVEIVLSTEGGEDIGQIYFCDSRPIDNTIFSAIIIFNMAVVCHQLSFQAGQIILRSRAQTLYEMCDRLLAIVGARPCDSQLTSTGCAICDLMYMGSLNNQAKIYMDAMDYDNSALFLNHLLQASSAFVVTGYGDNAIDIIMEEARQFFIANAVISLNLTGPAPAA